MSGDESGWTPEQSGWTPEQQIKALQREVARLLGEVKELRAMIVGDPTAEQPAGVLEAGHQAFVERIRGRRA